jgi:hypothetical protein
MRRNTTLVSFSRPPIGWWRKHRKERFLRKIWLRSGKLRNICELLSPFFPGYTPYVLCRILAANDKLWHDVQTSPTPEVPFVVSGIPHRVSEVCSELPCTAQASLVDSSITPSIMFPLRLVKLRDLVLYRPCISEDKLVELAYAQVKEDQARTALILQSLRKKEKGKGANKRRVAEENVRETRKVEEAARQPQDKVLEMQNELRLVTEKQAPKSPTTTQRSKGGTVVNRPSGPTWQMPTSRNPLAHACVVTSRSSKLNYLLKEARISFECFVCSPSLIRPRFWNIPGRRNS